MKTPTNRHLKRSKKSLLNRPTKRPRTTRQETYSHIPERPEQNQGNIKEPIQRPTLSILKPTQSPGKRPTKKDTKRHIASYLQHTSPHGNTLQHTAAHCNTLQHTATPETYCFIPAQPEHTPRQAGRCVVAAPRTRCVVS